MSQMIPEFNKIDKLKPYLTSHKRRGSQGISDSDRKQFKQIAAKTAKHFNNRKLSQASHTSYGAQLVTIADMPQKKGRNLMLAQYNSDMQHMKHLTVDTQKLLTDRNKGDTSLMQTTDNTKSFMEGTSRLDGTPNVPQQWDHSLMTPDMT